MMVTSLSSFSHNVFNSFKTKSNSFIDIVKFFSANSVKLRQAKKFAFGEELTYSQIHGFETIPNSKKLQTTTEMWLLNDF